jgi:hypothetical protein
MASDGMRYMPGFMRVDSDIQVILRLLKVLSEIGSDSIGDKDVDWRMDHKASRKMWSQFIWLTMGSVAVSCKHDNVS